MLSNIIVAIMCVMALAAGIFGWWMEKKGASEASEKKESETEKISKKG